MSADADTDVPAETAAPDAHRAPLQERRPKYRMSSLAIRFAMRRNTARDGLNFLQERGWISDNVVTLEDVAPCDAARVCSAFDNHWRWKGARLLK